MEAQISDVSNFIHAGEIDSESELEAIVGVDFLKGSEIDTQAELESVVTDATNIIDVAEIDTQAELEALITDATNLIDVGEINAESELEGLLADVTNVLTNNDDTDSLSEGSSNLYYTNERADDRVNALLQAGTGITLNYDDAGDTLTVYTTLVSSGTSVGLSPEYDGATYYGDGSNNVGQLSLQYDSSNKENYYKWTSSKTDLNDYTIAVRFRIPENFKAWDGESPIQFRYRTNASSADDNKITITMLDTAGSSVSLTNGANLANTSWTTATITGPNSAGTYTKGDYITLLVQVFARTTNSGEAHAGWIDLNWDTTMP